MANYIPHLRLMFMLLPARPRPLSNCKRPATLKHKRYGALANPHLRRRRGARSLELLIRNAMRHHPALEADAAGLEFVGAAGILAVDEAHELRRDVAVVVGRAVRVRCNVPARGEDQEVGEGRGRVAGARGQNAEDGRVDVVDGDGADVDEFCEIILVGDLDGDVRLTAIRQTNVMEGHSHNSHAMLQHRKGSGSECS